METGRELRLFRGHEYEIWGVAFSLDGKRALSGSGDKTLRLWDVETGKELRRFTGHTEGIRSVALSPQERQASRLSSAADETVRLWDAQTGRELRQFRGHQSEVWGLAFSPDSKRALSGGEDKTLRLWDVESGEESRGLSLNGYMGHIFGVAFGLDGGAAARPAGRKIRCGCGQTAPEPAGAKGRPAGRRRSRLRTSQGQDLGRPP